MMQSSQSRYLTTRSFNTGCNLCSDGSSTPIPDQQLSVPGMEMIPTCGALETTINSMLHRDSDQCLMLQSFGSICGCPVKPNACHLCGTPNKTVSNPYNEIQFLSSLFDGTLSDFVPNCQLTDAYLKSVDRNDGLCHLSQSYLANYCGCNNDEDSPELQFPCHLCAAGGEPQFQNKTINIPNSPFHTCQDVADGAGLLLKAGTETCTQLQTFADYCGCPARENACNVCPDGMLTTPHRQMDFFGNSLGGIDVTCEVYDSYSKSLVDSGTDDCNTLSRISGYCGCPPVESPCEFCPGEDLSPEYEDLEIGPYLAFYTGVNLPFVPTCKFMFELEPQIEGDSDLCSAVISRNDICGCKGGTRTYLYADTDAKRAAYVWAPRVGALLSFLGSSAMLNDILRSRVKRNQLYNQLVLFMSVFDILSSTAWILSSLPLPAESDLGLPLKVRGARGNHTTCTIQGFLVQIGYTSFMFNLSLSTYYYLAVVRSKRQRDMNRIRPFLVLVPLAVGIPLAFAAIPFYKPLDFVCHIAIPPQVESWVPVVSFVFVPIIFTIIVASALVLRVVCFVYAVDTSLFGRKTSSESERRSEVTVLDTSRITVETGASASANRSSRPRKNTSMEKLKREVTEQAVFYLSAFFLSYPLLFIANLFHEQIRAYWVYVICLFLAAFQGFSNATIYFRPRITRRMRNKKWCCRRRRRSVTVQENSGSNRREGSWRSRKGGTSCRQLYQQRDEGVSDVGSQSSLPTSASEDLELPGTTVQPNFILLGRHSRVANEDDEDFEPSAAITQIGFGYSIPTIENQDTSRNDNGVGRSQLEAQYELPQYGKRPNDNAGARVSATRGEEAKEEIGWQDEPAHTSGLGGREVDDDFDILAAGIKF